MTQPATTTSVYLPIESVFDTIDPTYGPGWRATDGDGPRLTLGHVDVATFNTRIEPIAGVPVRIDPTTIRHEWLQFSRHEEDCLLWHTTHRERCRAVHGGGLCDSSGTTACDVTLNGDATWCGCARFTGIESMDGSAVHLIDAEANAPGAVAVTWGEPDWDGWDAETDRAEQVRKRPTMTANATTLADLNAAISAGRERYDLASSEGRMVMVQRVAPLVARIPDPFDRAAAVAHLAAVLGRDTYRLARTVDVWRLHLGLPVDPDTQPSTIQAEE